MEYPRHLHSVQISGIGSVPYQGRRIRYQKADVIVPFGSSLKTVCLIVYGTVHVKTRATQDRGAALVAILGSGDWIMPESVASSRAHSMGAVARVAVTVHEYAVDRLSRSDWEAMNEQMAGAAIERAERLREFVQEDVEGRVLAALERLGELESAVRHPEGVMVKAFRHELAEMVGCTRETAGRAVQALHDAGVVQAKGCKILVIDQGIDQGLSVVDAVLEREDGAGDSAAGAVIGSATSATAD